MGGYGLALVFEVVHDQTQSPRLGRFHLDTGEIKDLRDALGRARHGQQVVAMPNAS
jgi:hypothetical protein